jgi:hypothetical protein
LGACCGCASRFTPDPGTLAPSFGFAPILGFRPALDLEPALGLEPPFDLALPFDLEPPFDFAPACEPASGAELPPVLPFGFPGGFVRPFARAPGFAFDPGAPFSCPLACPGGAAPAPRSAFQGCAGGPRRTGTFVG